MSTGHNGCLPFSQKNLLVEICSKWDASKPQIGNVHRMCVFHFHRHFEGDGYKLKVLELVPKSKWNTAFPFGNSVWDSWTAFQAIPFSPEIYRLGRPNCSFSLHSNRNFWIWGVNGKQPTCLHFRLLVSACRPGWKSSADLVPFAIPCGGIYRVYFCMVLFKAAILLVSTKHQDLLPPPTPEVCDSRTRCRIRQI